jgi:hypothetical protein
MIFSRNGLLLNKVSFNIRDREFEILRYAQTRKGYTISDDHVCFFWNRMLLEERAHRWCVCVKASQYNAWNFLRDAKRYAPNMWFVARRKPFPASIGFVVFTNARPHRAELHMQCYDAIRTDLIRAPKVVLDTLMEVYNLNMVYGFVPSVFDRALKFFGRLGFEQSGVLPGGSYLAEEDRFVDSTIVTYRREK